MNLAVSDTASLSKVDDDFLTDGSSRHGVARARSSTPVRIASAVFGVLLVIHVSDVMGSVTSSIIVGAGMLAGVLGLWLNRPRMIWPWIALLANSAVWFVANLLDGDHENLGELDKARVLFNDLLTLPGYLMFGVALMGMLRARRRHADLALALDGLVLMFGAALVVQHTLIGPTLQLSETWLPARLLVAAFPTASLVLLGVAAQLAFSRGQRSLSFLLVLAGTLALVIGDVVWAFAEIGRLDAAPSLLEIPHLFVPVCLGLAMLHPAVCDLDRTDSSPARASTTGRYLAVATALVAPTALVLFPASIAPATILLSVGLCVSSGTRVALAMRAEDISRASLMYQATHDSLTDLPSRQLLLDEVDRRLGIRGGASVSVIFVDLDRFKNVNDLFGHHTGDALLIAVAERLGTLVRDDDVVARLSGDEFVIAMGGLGSAATPRVANRIRAALMQPFNLDAGEVLVTASLGISIAEPCSGKSAAQLVQEADTAMYESKSGRNETTIFDKTMQDRATRRMQIEQLLRHATDAPQFTTYFQPIIDSSHNRVVGFEALLRWNAMGENLSPAEFIPIAEDSGLIVEIGAFVLDEACRQAAWWRANIPGGQNLYVSVNLSPRQVVSPDIVDTVAQALRTHGLPADALWLEITETIMTEDSVTTAAAMTGLRMLGVRLALDDFGTGYSSLSSLQYLPVSRVKIDRRFIMGLGSNESNDKLVKCITAVAASFDLDIVAEGVETSEQLAHLQAVGCTQIQGYLYSPAVAAVDVPAVFSRLHRPPRVRSHRPARSAR